LVSEGFSAFIVDEVNGLSRVSIGNVNSKAEAQELSSKAKSLGYTGWILNK
jgi:cell division protein FtsN